MIIAEIGQAHDGSLGILHSYIDALAGTGVDAIKFQTHIAAAESSHHEAFRVPFSYVDRTRFDYWKRMELSVEQWKGIKAHCDEAGLLFISSPFSNAAVDVLEEAGVAIYKMGSGEVSNHLLLQKIIATGKPLILSSGLSTLQELDETIAMCKHVNTRVSLLQCTTSYPAMPADWGLHIITTLKQRYTIPIGFSDHSGDIFACMAATALGAEIIEFHVVFDKRMFGPDAKASVEIRDVPRLVSGVKQIRESLQHVHQKDEATAKVTALKKLFGKTLCVNKKLPAGHRITFNDLEGIKPAGLGIDPKYYKKLLGKSLKEPMMQWQILQEENLYSAACIKEKFV